MYGKIFDSIYDGTLRTNWQALVTFQQLIILADKSGVVDMTPHAIHGRTGIPMDIIEAGLDHLTKPDPYSRSTEEDGRRLVPIDESRPWGWRLVNHGYYNRLRSMEEKREADRVRASTKRKALNKGVSHTVADSREASPEIAEIAPITIAVPIAVTVPNTIQELDSVGLTPDVGSLNGKKKVYREEAKQVLAFLNEKTGHAYREVDSNLNPIESILKSGVSLEDMRTVTMRKVRDWRTDPKMVTYLRPSTLYRRSNFEQYLGQTIKPEADPFRGAI